jgi:7-keto-8-aminopelargonate synthetase-like enzyme
VYGKFQEYLNAELENIESAGLYKHERFITTPQSAHVGVNGGEMLNLCANNYLGLAQHPEVNAAAKRALEEWGFGMASVRFICGTQTLHKQLEDKLSKFLETEDTILYPSCFDANGGLFETLLGKEDAIISDELNHASIIDGVRLCSAQRYRYRNSDMTNLEEQLQTADKDGARFKLITTDGVFSMDGFIARIDDLKMAARSVPGYAWPFLRRFWPGALTVILPKAASLPDEVTAGQDTVAVRLPDPPAYYAPNMDLEVTISRGDVYYDPPLDAEGKRVLIFVTFGWSD